MNIKVLLLILISIGLSAIAQVTLKFKMSRNRVRNSLAGLANRVDALLTVLTEPVYLRLFRLHPWTIPHARAGRRMGSGRCG